MPKHHGSTMFNHGILVETTIQLQAGRRWEISAPRPNVVAMATRIGPTTFYMVPSNRPPRKPRSRPQHHRSICHTSRVIGDFVQLQILGVRGPKSKIEEQRFVECHMERWRPKMARFRRETKKIRSDLKEQRDKQTDAQTDRVSDKNNRLLA